MTTMRSYIVGQGVDTAGIAEDKKNEQIIFKIFIPFKQYPGK